MLECFAYWKETPSGGVRWGTLITAGGDPTIVGNAVLKNPGSAEPAPSLFRREDGRMNFTVDATMHALADLFLLRSGTIRLFNLLDIRAVNPDDALRQLDAGVSEASLEDVAMELTEGPHVPTYLGWGELWRHPKLEAKARTIFDIVLQDTPSLESVMADNPFFHPLFLMRYGTSRPKCSEQVSRFRNILGSNL